jgi:hypothetical protein
MLSDIFQISRASILAIFGKGISYNINIAQSLNVPFIHCTSHDVDDIANYSLGLKTDIPSSMLNKEPISTVLMQSLVKANIIISIIRRSTSVYKLFVLLGYIYIYMYIIYIYINYLYY